MKNQKLMILLTVLVAIAGAVVGTATTSKDSIQGIRDSTFYDAYTFAGNNTHSGGNNFTGNNSHSGTESFTGNVILGSGVARTAVSKTASFVVDPLAANLYLVSTAGGAVNGSLPAPSTVTGQTVTFVLTAAAGALTLTAAPYSINGAVSNNTIDSAYDTLSLYSTGTGYVLTSRYIQ
jgi:hypothetical protein